MQPSGNTVRALSNEMRTTIRQDMFAYDELPEAVRRRMAGAILPFSAENAKQLMVRAPEAVVVSIIEGRDKRIIAEHRRKVSAALDA